MNRLGDSNLPKTIKTSPQIRSIFGGINGAPRSFGDLGRMAIYFQGAGEHW